MSSCCSSFFAANQGQFGDAVARRDLTRYRTRGPDETTRLLLDAVLKVLVALLVIGAICGAIAVFRLGRQAGIGAPA